MENWLLGVQRYCAVSVIARIVTETSGDQRFVDHFSIAFRFDGLLGDNLQRFTQMPIGGAKLTSTEAPRFQRMRCCDPESEPA
jgi:hypothetical protein